MKDPPKSRQKKDKPDFIIPAIPDHYDRAHDTYESDVANLQKFVEESRLDDEEALAVEAAKKLKMEKELYRLVRLIDQTRSDETEGNSETLPTLVLFRHPTKRHLLYS